MRAYFHASISSFLNQSADEILGQLSRQSEFAVEEPQRRAWLTQRDLMKDALAQFSNERGEVFFEFQIPRMGKRADAVLLLRDRVFVLEFKVGETEFQQSALGQCMDYALDLKNFHSGSHGAAVIPVLVATKASNPGPHIVHFAEDWLSSTLKANGSSLAQLLNSACEQVCPIMDFAEWMESDYRPTPTIIEAAQALYERHRVEDITRYDAGAINLRTTSEKIESVIEHSRRNGRKSLCFVTGVPGSGKTLAGLNIATRDAQSHPEENAVFLSGNGPLVMVLREALARDKAAREKCSKSKARREVRTFIQNIHHFRDHYVSTPNPPFEKVVVFDEAQRAWSREQASRFMREHNHPDFDMSEPEFLLSVMDRHQHWCTVICLIGGGQEINTGEAGISEWIDAIRRKHTEWDVYISPRIAHPDYGIPGELDSFINSPHTKTFEDLHLGVSMRSFRAERVSEFVGDVVDGNASVANELYCSIRAKYPIFLTRDLDEARKWLRKKARGSERTGLLASSGALRLRPEGIHIKSKVDPECWFLNPTTDIRSSGHLEEVATQFDVQGLELDWCAVCWDGDFRRSKERWLHQSFRGTSWNQVRKHSDQTYIKNAYRVILTRARQGMVVFVPRGDSNDRTRLPSLYDDTFEFLRACGIRELTPPIKNSMPS